MRKYMSILLILAIACAFSLSVVVAADNETQDFDGKFKMDVVKGCDFERTDDSDGFVTFMDIGKGVCVMYVDDPTIHENMSESFYESINQTPGFEDEGTDGDIHIYLNNNMYAALVPGEGIGVFAASPDKDTAVEMAKTIEFTNQTK